MIIRLGCLALLALALALIGPPVGEGLGGAALALGQGAQAALIILAIGGALALLIFAGGWVFIEYRSRQWAALLHLAEIEELGRRLDVAQRRATLRPSMEVLDYAELTTGPARGYYQDAGR